MLESKPGLSGCGWLWGPNESSTGNCPCSVFFVLQFYYQLNVDNVPALLHSVIERIQCRIYVKERGAIYLTSIVPQELDWEVLVTSFNPYKTALTQVLSSPFYRGRNRSDRKSVV